MLHGTKFLARLSVLLKLLMFTCEDLLASHLSEITVLEMYPHSWLWTHPLSSLPGTGDEVTFEACSAKVQLQEPSLAQRLCFIVGNIPIGSILPDIFNPKNNSFILIFKGNFCTQEMKSTKCSFGESRKKYFMDSLPYSNLFQLLRFWSA